MASIGLVVIDPADFPATVDSIDAASGLAVSQAWVDETIRRAKAFIESTKAWPYEGEHVPGVKSKKHDVRRQQGDGKDHWCVRESRHPTPSYERFRRGLFEQHAEHEQEYIPSLVRVERWFGLKAARGEVMGYRNTYKLPFPLAKRQMIELILTAEEESGKSFFIVSLPMAGPVEKGYVRGMYASVEHVAVETQDYDGKETALWTMATASDAGGNLPRAFQNPAIPGQIAHDVPRFLEWEASLPDDDVKH